MKPERAADILLSLLIVVRMDKRYAVSKPNERFDGDGFEYVDCVHECQIYSSGRMDYCLQRTSPGLI